MHATTPHGLTTGTRVSQVDADRCCAFGERGTSTPSTPSYVPSTTLALLAGPIPTVGPDVAVFRETPSAPTPLDVSRVPKHLLLSVFLI